MHRCAPARHHFNEILVAAAVIVLAYSSAASAQSDWRQAVGTPLARDEYLKLTGENWERIQRTPDGQVRTLAQAVTQTSGGTRSLATTTVASPNGGGLFQPYVALPTGSWPEAVAIGDVNGDGLNDVVMVTSFYFDPSNDYTLFVWLQNPDGTGTLAPPAKYYLGGRPASVAIGDVNGDGHQ